MRCDYWTARGRCKRAAKYARATLSDPGLQAYCAGHARKSIFRRACYKFDSPEGSRILAAAIASELE